MHATYGTAYYIAPEVLNGNYTEKCDLWSIGVILYILLSGCPPFAGLTDSDILKRVKEGKVNFNNSVWQRRSNDSKDLIKKLLTYDPEERISAREALEHRWIRH
jgi:calcium-dependent protein kinase